MALHTSSSPFHANVADDLIAASDMETNKVIISNEHVATTGANSTQEPNMAHANPHTTSNPDKEGNQSPSTTSKATTNDTMQVTRDHAHHLPILALGGGRRHAKGTKSSSNPRSNHPIVNPYTKPSPTTGISAMQFGDKFDTTDSIKDGWSDDDFVSADEDNSSNATDTMQQDDATTDDDPKTATKWSSNNIATLSTLGRTKSPRKAHNNNNPKVATIAIDIDGIDEASAISKQSRSTVNFAKDDFTVVTSKQKLAMLLQAKKSRFGLHFSRLGSTNQVGMNPTDITKLFKIIQEIDPEALILPHNNSDKKIL